MLSKKVSLLFPIFILSTVLFGQPGPGEVLRLQHLIDQGAYEEAKTLAYQFLEDDDKSAEWYYVHSKLGDILYYQGDMIGSLDHYLKALDFEEIHEPQNLRTLEETNSYIGFLYREFGLDKRAEKWFRQALDEAEELQDSAEIAVCYYNISTVLLSQGQLDASMGMLQKAYEIDVSRLDTSGIGFDLKMMGSAQMTLGNPQRAIDYFQQSISLLKQSSGNRNSLGNRYGLVSKAFMEMDQWDSAVHYSHLAIADYAENGDSLNLGDQWISRARIALGKGAYSEAVSWGQKAEAYFSSIDPGAYLLDARGVIADAYSKLGQSSRAINLIKANQNLSRNLGMLPELHAALKAEGALLEGLSKYRGSLELYRQAEVIKDSMDAQRSAQLVDEMRVRYDVDKTENENQLLKLENELALAEVAQKDTLIKSIYMIGFLILLFGSVVAWVLVSRNRMKAEMLQAEINELRTRIKGVLEFKPEQVGVVKEQINRSLGEPLSDREFEILNLALSDKSNAQIADEVFVSVNTVKYHLKNIYSKLGVSDRKQAMKYVVQLSSN